MDACNGLACRIDDMMVVQYVLQSFRTKEDGKPYLINVLRQYVTLKVVNSSSNSVPDSYFVRSSRSKFHHFSCRTTAHNDQEYRVYTATRESDDTH